ncbi:MAG: CapA family protein, partial [Rikenellaceae bacterium]|nr:CapA family protein [Rikenellaceae bacterium]
MKTFLSILYTLLLVALVAGEVLYVEWVVPMRKLAATVRNVATLPPPTVRRARVVFGGDVMAHTPQLSAAKTVEGYSFERTFEYVAPILCEADLAVINLETTLSHQPPY